MIDLRSSTTEERSPEADAPRELFVPVDATAAARRPLDLAIRLARQSPSRIIFIDVLPDAESRTSTGVRQVLLPLQREVEEAGVPASIHSLQGSDPVLRLRELLRSSAPGRALVLGNPLELSGPLREVTGDLLVNQPCDVYLTSRSRGASKRRGMWFHRIVESVCRRHAF
jgi:nucleotide-binding universal stress UspA family protein